MVFCTKKAVALFPGLTDRNNEKLNKTKLAKFCTLHGKNKVVSITARVRNKWEFVLKFSCYCYLYYRIVHKSKVSFRRRVIVWGKYFESFTCSTGNQEIRFHYLRGYDPDIKKQQQQKNKLRARHGATIIILIRQSIIIIIIFIVIIIIIIIITLKRSLKHCISFVHVIVHNDY